MIQKPKTTTESMEEVSRLPPEPARDLSDERFVQDLTRFTANVEKFARSLHVPWYRWLWPGQWLRTWRERRARGRLTRAHAAALGIKERERESDDELRRRVVDRLRAPPAFTLSWLQQFGEVEVNSHGPGTISIRLKDPADREYIDRHMWVGVQVFYL